MIDTCRACGSRALRPLVFRAGVPLHQNRLASTRAEALGSPRGDLDLAACTGCGLVFNRAFRAELLAYGPGYENDQTASPLFAAHVDERIAAMVADGVRGREVLEVGCGSGDFLRRLCRAGENRGLGFDPVARGGSFDDGGGVRIEARHFPAAPLPRPMDVALSRHVVEHLAEPVAFLALVRRSLGSNPDGRLYLETPGLEWILENAAIWDLFYEHAAYFGERSLRNAIALAGLRVVACERVFGGQYLWIVAAPADSSIQIDPPSTEDLALLDRFAARVESDTEHWRERVGAWAAEGDVAVWSAGAKGATFLHLVDPERASIRLAVDVHPGKQGRFVAGTGHAVVAPDLASLDGVRTVVVMNPNYRDEVERTIATIGLAARIEVAERTGRAGPR